MTEIFPELAKLKGGKKNFWISRNLDLVAALNDTIGFDTTAKVLHMKADTLSRALVRAEGHHRPQITLAEKALNRGVLHEGKINDIVDKLNRHAAEFDEHVEDDNQLREHLEKFYQLQAAANTIMAELMSSTRHTRNLTYHIISKPLRKVGPSLRAGSSPLFPGNKKRSGFLLSQGVPVYKKRKINKKVVSHKIQNPHSR